MSGLACSNTRKRSACFAGNARHRRRKAPPHASNDAPHTSSDHRSHLQPRPRGHNSRGDARCPGSEPHATERLRYAHSAGFPGRAPEREHRLGSALGLGRGLGSGAAEEERLLVERHGRGDPERERAEHVNPLRARIDSQVGAEEGAKGPLPVRRHWIGEPEGQRLEALGYHRGAALRHEHRLLPNLERS